MKKILSLLLVLAVLFGLAGCLPSQVPETTAEPTTQTTAAVTEATEATEPSTEATVPESEPEPTQAPTEKPEPKPTQPKPKPTQPEQEEQPRPTQDPHETEPEETEPEETKPAPQKSYTGKEEVAAYIAKYGRLPDNFITKSQAKSYGWKSGRRLEDYAPGMCIGGDRFYNKEGLLPSGTYYECDIDTLGVKNRGAKRIVFSKSGDIYYTSDHYASFYRYVGPNQWEKV